MPDTPSSPVAYRFGPFRLSVEERILERGGERLLVTPKVIDTLFVLVENARQVVTKEELMKAVWPDVTVVESGLTRNISALRKALEKGAPEGAYLETIPRRGYRFVADVTIEGAPPPSADPPPKVVAPVRRMPRWVQPEMWLAIAATITMAWSVWRPRPAVPPAEPDVRIGEHMLYKLAPEETLRAVNQFQQAIARNPQSAPAHAGLSIALLHLPMLGVRGVAEVMPQGRELALRASSLDGDSATAHYALGLVHLLGDWDFAKAEREFQRSLELGPQSAQTRLGYGQLLIVLGRLEAAQKVSEEALAIDPASPALGTNLCRIFYFRQDYRRAEAECSKVLDREPSFALAHYYRGLTLGQLGQFAEAEKALNRSGLMPGIVKTDHAWLQAIQGNRQAAKLLLESRRTLVRDGSLEPSSNLLLAAILGHNDEAFQAIDAGIRAKAPELLTIAVEPRLGSLRSDPRFSDALRRIGIFGR